MDHLCLVDGLRQDDALVAINAQITRVLHLVMAGDAPSMVIRAGDSPLRLVEPKGGLPWWEVVLAAGVYRVNGEILDTRFWPDQARMVRLPSISVGSVQRVVLRHQRGERLWPRGGAAYDPSAPPAADAGVAIACVDLVAASRPPLLRLVLCPDRHGPCDGLVLGRVRWSHDCLELAPDFLFPCPQFGDNPAARGVVEHALAPLLTIVDDLDGAAPAVSDPARVRRIDAALAWADRVRDALSLRAEPPETVLALILKANARLARQLGVPFALSGFAPEDAAIGLCLPPLLGCGDILRSLKQLRANCAQPALDQPAAVELDSAALEVARGPGQLMIRAALDRPLRALLGGSAMPRGIEIIVAPREAGRVLRPGGPSLLHPDKIRAMLPESLGAIPTEAAGNALRLVAPFTGTEHATAAMSEVLDAQHIRLILGVTHDADGGAPPQLVVKINSLV